MVVQPPGAVIASLLRSVICAIIRSPVLTDAGRTSADEEKFVLFETACTEQPLKSPGNAPGHVPTSAIASLPKGVGRLAPCSNRRHDAALDFPNASESADSPDVSFRAPRATSSFAPTAGRIRDAAGWGRPSESATNVGP